MQRLALTLQVKPEKKAAYLKAHQRVWPELIDAARAAGLRNHSVFIQGNTLFLYVEAKDIHHSLSVFMQTEVKGRWDREMAPFLDEKPAAPANEISGELEEVFHFD